MRDASARLKETHAHNVLDTSLGFGQQAGFPFPATENPECVSRFLCICVRVRLCLWPAALHFTSRTHWSRLQPANTGCLG